MFLNRFYELSHLKKLWKTDTARFIIVYGRRRIGKTELLRQFSRDKPHVFFSSDLSSEKEQLRQFTEKIHANSGEAFLADHPFGSWEALLRYVFDHLAGKIPLIIIDEFPYLCAENPALPSILQKIWDEKGAESQQIPQRFKRIAVGGSGSARHGGQAPQIPKRHLPDRGSVLPFLVPVCLSPFQLPGGKRRPVCLGRKNRT